MTGSHDEARKNFIAHKSSSEQENLYEVFQYNFDNASYGTSLYGFLIYLNIENSSSHCTLGT